MSKKPEDEIVTQDYLDRKLGVLVEHMNDQFQRVLESMESRLQPLDKIGPMEEKIQTINDRLEVVEYDAKITRKTVESMKNDIHASKVRSDMHEDTLIQHSKRLEELESKS